MRRMVRRRLLLALVPLLLLAACVGGGGSRAGSADDLVVQVASYDLALGRPRRLIVGLLTNDQQPIGGGTVELRLAAKGGKPREPVEAKFLPIPQEDGHVDAPGASPHAHGAASEDFGVYSAEVTFDRAGFWEVEVTTEDGRSGEASFDVLQKPRVPDVGDQAIPSENLTVDAENKQAVDSRAATGHIPDPELHRTTIKAALENKRPVLVVFSTPVYCVSRFCGPVTDVVASMAAKYPDKAEYIHVEIWNDRNKNAINKSAAEWLFRDENLTEPWVFLIGGDGVIRNRWDNVATAGEIEAALQTL